YLQAEGETISSQEIKSLLQQGYHHLDNNLPEDIKAIYFNDDMEQVSTSINQFLQVSKEPKS
ncbi:MAG: sigma-70 family RNA polymerase sigma factor, partial [Okeania sp. SIO1H6]|nr:sigma-70 family RNA polymerase sigma factor [Okeania sp. SIO1H6]